MNLPATPYSPAGTTTTMPAATAADTAEFRVADCGPDTATMATARVGARPAACPDQGERQRRCGMEVIERAGGERGGAAFNVGKKKHG